MVSGPSLVEDDGGRTLCRTWFCPSRFRAPLAVTQWPVSRARFPVARNATWTLLVSLNKKVGVPLPPAVCTDRYPFISTRGRVQTGKEDGREGSKGPRELNTSGTEQRNSAVAFCSGGAYQGAPLSTGRTPSGLQSDQPPCSGSAP